MVAIVLTILIIVIIAPCDCGQLLNTFAGQKDN